MAFKTQNGLKSYDFNENDNLFSGVWNLNNDNLQKYDPFITGYAFIVWTKLPAFFDEPFAKRFKGITEKNFKSFSGVSDMNLNVEDVTHGFAGNAYGVATGLQKENNSFSITHIETSGSPIRELYSYWVMGISDSETGLARYHGKISNDMPYSAKNHTGELLYIVTDPSGGYKGSGVEFACYYTNVLPTKVPQDHLNYSSGDHSSVEITMDFRGNYHQSETINAMAVNFLKTNYIKNGFESYNPNLGDKGPTMVGSYDSNFNTK